MSTEHWPAYVLRLSEPLRASLSAEAAAGGRSLQATMRAILCAHYGLEPPRGISYAAVRDTGATSYLLRANPELFSAIRDDAAKQGRSMRAVVVDVLETYFEREAVA